MADIDRDGEGGAERRVVVGDHRLQLEAAGLGARQRGADDAGGVADDEGELLGRGMGGGEDQVALVLAVVVVGDDDDLAALEGGDGLGDAFGFSHGDAGIHGMEFSPVWNGRKVERRAARFQGARP